MSRRIVWRSWPSGDGPGAPGVVEIQQPSRAPTIESDFSVPALQALVTGVIGGSAVTSAICLLWHTALFPCWPATMALAAGAGWIWRMAESANTLYRTEQMLVDAPAPVPFTPSIPLLGRPDEAVNATIAIRDDVRRLANQERLIDFVRRCKTVGTSESAQGIRPNDRAQYLADRDTLMRLGLATWRGPNHLAGWELTVAPAQAFVVIRKHVLN